MLLSTGIVRRVRRVWIDLPSQPRVSQKPRDIFTGSRSTNTSGPLTFYGIIAQSTTRSLSLPTQVRQADFRASITSPTPTRFRIGASDRNVETNGNHARFDAR